MLRCVRGGCTEEVVAGLGYDIRAQQAWIYDLEPEIAAGGSVAPDGAMALCEKHTGLAKVPQGWKLENNRTSSGSADLNSDSDETAALPPEVLPTPKTDPVPRPEPSAPQIDEPDRVEPTRRITAQPVEPIQEVTTETPLLERAFRAVPARYSPTSSQTS